MLKNKRVIIGCATSRYITTKTGTYLVCFDAISGRCRRINLSRMHKTSGYRVIGLPKTR